MLEEKIEKSERRQVDDEKDLDGVGGDVEAARQARPVACERDDLSSGDDRQISGEEHDAAPLPAPRRVRYGAKDRREDDDGDEKRQGKAERAAQITSPPALRIAGVIPLENSTANAAIQWRGRLKSEAPRAR
jgi:hypothetical protein